MLDCDKINYANDSYAPIQGAKTVLQGVSSVAKTFKSTFFGGSGTDKGDASAED